MSNVLIPIKEQAVAMRKQGCSYNEISAKLGLAKSTLSGWLKDVEIPIEIRQSKEMRNRMFWSNSIKAFNAQRHKDYLANVDFLLAKYADEVPDMTDRDMFFLFMGLFWGEGNKKSPFAVRIANADPLVIKVCMCFFEKHFHLSKTAITVRAHVHKNNDPKTAAVYWSEVTGVPVEKVKTSLVVSSASRGKKPTNSLPYGTCNLTICNASLNKQIMGWLRGVAKKAILPK